MVPEELQPGGEVVKCLWPRRVIDQDSSIGISEIGRDEGLVLFLASSVPQLEPEGSLVESDIPGEEVDPDGGLNRGSLTLVEESN